MQKYARKRGKDNRGNFLKVEHKFWSEKALAKVKA